MLITNTHLFWNPAHEDVKMRQIMYFVERIQAYRRTLV